MHGNRSASKFTSAYLHVHVCRVSPNSWSITHPTSLGHVFCTRWKDIRFESSSPRQAQKCWIDCFRLCHAYRCKFVSKSSSNQDSVQDLRDPASSLHYFLLSFSILHILVSSLFRRKIWKTWNFLHNHVN